VTDSQIAALAAELANDPLSLGYAARVAVGDDAGIAALLNTPRGDATPGIIDIATVQAALHTMTHASTMPVWIVIEDYAANEQGDVGLRACCRMVLAVVGGKYQTIDFSLAAVQQILGGLVAGTLLTQEQADTLVGLSARQWSRAEVLFGKGASVTNIDVARALRGS
jgi:hypothetical protein